jgi:hypothetical protein
MAQTRSAAADQTTPDDLNSFLKAIPDGRFQSWGALLAVVPAAGGGAGDPERLPQLP